MDLQYVNLQDCNLTKSVFCGSNLSHAVVNGACMKQTDLRDAQIDGVDLRSAKLDQTKIDFNQAVRMAQSMGCIVE